MTTKVERIMKVELDNHVDYGIAYFYLNDQELINTLVDGIRKQVVETKNSGDKDVINASELLGYINTSITIRITNCINVKE